MNFSREETVSLTFARVLRQTKEWFSRDLFQLGASASKTSQEKKDEFLDIVSPYVARVYFIQEHRKDLFKKFLKLPKEGKARIEFLNELLKKGIFGGSANQQAPKQRATPKQAPRQRATPKQAPRQRATPKQAPKQASTKEVDRNVDKVAEKAKSTKKNLLELENEHKITLQVKKISAYEKANKKKIKAIEKVVSTEYLNTEEIKCRKEEKYRIAKETVKELRVQLSLLNEELEYYKNINVDEVEYNRVEILVLKKKKELLSASKDIEFFAPPKKNNFIESAVKGVANLLFSPFKVLVPVKQKQLSTAQLVQIKARGK